MNETAKAQVEIDHNRQVRELLISLLTISGAPRDTENVIQTLVPLFERDHKILWKAENQAMDT